MLRLIIRTLLMTVIAVSLAGCASGTRLPVPPNVLRDGSGSTQLRELPAAAQTPDMHLFYVTDRLNEGQGQAR